MSPRQTRSTLFPYTTLFRSQVQHAAAADEVRDGEDAGAEAGAQRVQGTRKIRRDLLRLDQPGDGGGAGRARAAGDIDRKSTRLNSSHLGISYAVFCLKKKKK